MVDVSSQNNSVSINVSSGGNSASIKATPDTAQYYSEKSREWATSNRIVDNTDYSSKYYAEKSKESEAKAENYERSIIEKYNSFVEISNRAETEFETLKNDSILQINEVTNLGISDITNKTSEAVTEININKQDAISEIENTQNNAIEQLEKEAKEQLQNIESTGFYMRDDKLYFINSKGEEEEFKSGDGGGLPMFSPFWSDHLYNDASYLRADTFSWHDADIYVTGYNELLKEYNNENCVEEVENGVTFKRSPNGFKIANADQHDNVRLAYENTGIAWFYLLDTENERFKLPRTEYGFTGVRDGVGNPVEAGSPDIQGNLGLYVRGDGAVSGAFYADSTKGTQAMLADGAVNKLGFKASRSNPIYGNSDTVQPPATQMYLYFYVGAYKISETEVNLGQMSEVLNNKVDIDFNNVPSNSVGLARYSTEVTNCIAKKPQKFNLELVDGVLTLKSGSIVTIANSFEADETTPKFDEITVNANASSSSATANTKVLISYSTSSNVLIALPLANSTAGAGVTAKSGLAFDTTTNKISSYNSSGSLQYADCCLPLAIVSTDSSGKYISIDQTFHSIGYIGTAGTTGSTIWIDKGVTFLIPDGRNEDGTLKNIVFTTNKLVRRDGVKTATHTCLAFYSTNAIGVGTGFMSCKTYADRDTSVAYQLVEDLNETYVTTRDYAEPLCVFANISCDGSKITSFKPKNVFRALDWNEFATLQSLTKAYITETYVSGTSWYRVWSDGWIEQGGKLAKSTTSLTFLKSFSNTNYNFQTTYNGTGSGLSGTGYPTALTKSGATIVSASQPVFWLACGY